MPRPSLDQIFQGTAPPVPLYQPTNENDRNTAIADVYEPKRPSLDDIFAQQASQQPKTDMFDTISDNALQGGTFGLGNRAQAGLAALVESGINGKPISENYEAARNIKSQQLRDEMQQHPVAAIGSNVVGALATGGLGADTAAGSVIADSLRAGNLPFRMLKGAGAGAVSGAAYGAGTADYGKSTEGAEQGAINGALTGGAIPAAGAALSDVGNTALNTAKGAFARSPEALQDATSRLKGVAGNFYNQMRQAGATFKPSAVQGFLLPDIDNAVGKNNFIPALNPKTTAIIDDLKQKAATGDLGLDHLDQYRRLLGRVGGSEDGVSAGAARKAIDDFVNNANASHLSNGSTQAIGLLNQGRKQYQQASKFEDIAGILQNAGGDPNKIKSALTRFANNSDNTAGWSAQEIQTLKDAASRTGTEQIMRGLGTFGFDLGQTKNWALPALASGGSILNPGLGIPAVVGGTIARQSNKYAARGAGENLLNVLENGVGNSVGNSGFPFLPSSPVPLPMLMPSMGMPMPNISSQTRVTP